ncbi:MAG: family 10 glycosylhydrolase [Calditrichae bacterium]|nr:family 10 glycosylhydrolase [Calditrichia bacterium]
MKHNIFTLVILLSILVSCYGQTEPPKREFRAAWIASVVNLDWPSSPNISSDAQKQELITQFKQLKDLGFNAILLQIRSECDAMYYSEIDPWSYWLTGNQGTPPSPYYDPLEFAVEEAHKMGLELHAWFNPYRAVRDITGYSVSSDHVSRENPEWIITKGNLKILDPGIPMVQQYVTDVVMDVVNRYDIDGVHFDDYFYPYEGTTLSDDQASFDLYRGSFPNTTTGRYDWRRNNVNTLVAMIYDSIQTVKPYVAFGISPFGIWKSGVPAGIVGLSAYSDIYCDATAWLSSQTIDYLTPQLYWPFGGGQDYGKLMPWWASQMNGRHLIPGQGAYRIVNWDEEEMPAMLYLNRETENVYGSIFFRSKAGILDNPRGFADSLSNNFYKYKALVPGYEYKDQIAPNEPESAVYTAQDYGDPYTLNWNLPQLAADGDSASKYVIYRYSVMPQEGDTDNPKYILDMTSMRSYTPEVPEQSGEYYFQITSLDRNNNESPVSNTVTVVPPEIPLIASPVDNAINLSDTTVLSWYYTDKASQYYIQIAENELFNTILSETNDIQDTSATLPKLDGLSKYYWRIAAANAAGKTAYSDPFSFTTGFPLAPSLYFPRSGATNTPLELDLTWHPADSAKQYQVQIATTSFFGDGTVLLDTVVSDTTFLATGLDNFKRHYWHVAGLNQYGKSNWSDTWLFKTIDITSITDAENIPLKFGLSQNYPNPFNPETIIPFSIEEQGMTTLTVYNILGQKVVELVNKTMMPGKYTINFAAGNLSSGIYIYRLVNNNKSSIKKMMLIR